MRQQSGTNARNWRVLLVVIGTSLVPVQVLPSQDAGNSTVDYIRDVKPIFEQHCYRCHGPEKQRSGLRLDQRGNLLKGGESGEPAIVPGKGAVSHLIQLVRGKIADTVMPPNGKRLNVKQIEVLRRWIDEGAKWSGGVTDDEEFKLTTNHWSFQPLAKVTPPKNDDPWIANAIDAFILARLQEAGLKPSRSADRRTLIRRLFLDMHGLPPSPEQIQRFLEDKRANAYERLVDEVLASPRYGERWAQHWLDVVRYADTHGFEVNTPREHAWPYRDYVIEALNTDKPYNRFVFEQLAGDAVGVDAATGFLVAGPQDQVKSPDPRLTAQQRQDELNEIINATSSTFLGLTVSCARCHNHKFDPILQKDYYSFQAVFAGVKYGNRPWNKDSDQQREQRLAALKKKLAAVSEKLQALEPVACNEQTLVIDDEDMSHVKVLAPKAGRGINPPGGSRGEKDDAGDVHRLPNISNGYSWWNQKPGEDLIAYHPKAAGSFGIWISWGCGWKTHVKDACYLIDLDGKLETKEDQKLIATVDQQKFADGAGDIPSRPLWSGLYFAGVQKLKSTSCIVVRGGTTGPATTADTIVLQQMKELEGGDDKGTPPRKPKLRPPVVSTQNVESFNPVLAKYVRFTIFATNNAIEPCIDELEIWSAMGDSETSKNVALASSGATADSSGNYSGNPKHKLQHINDGRYGNARSWISNERGKGWVQITLPKVVPINRIVWGRDLQQKYKDRTPVDYQIEVAVKPGQWQIVASSKDRIPYLPKQPAVTFVGGNLTGNELQQLQQFQKEVQSLTSQIQSLSQPRLVFAGKFEQPSPTKRLYRGDPLAPREPVKPDTLSVLGSLGLSLNAPEQKRRVALANWIVSKDNPLTARVMVNRIWQHHFGAGMVATPSDFGKNGARPTHSQLLDWLARRFMREGWSMKEIHRLILLSNTYKQSSVGRAQARKIDAQNRLLWHFPQRRLEAEVIRDSVLAVSGTLNSKMGGPGFSVFKPNDNYVRNYIPKDNFGPEEWRRMVYVYKVRMEKDAVFGAFDCPDAGQPQPKRTQSTTAIQALNLFNSRFISQQAKLFASRIETDAGEDRKDQIERAFQLALGRSPTPAEAQACLQVAQQHGLEQVCRVLLNTNEFLFLP